VNLKHRAVLAPPSNLLNKIIFYPGTHGHYIEFVLNRLVTKHSLTVNPIDAGGTFHNATGNDTYVKNRYFKCYHPGTRSHPIDIDPIKEIKKDEFFIKINFGPDEDVTVQQLALRRGPNISIDLESITKNTYDKLMSLDSCDAVEIINNINQYSDITPYSNIKDPSWPDISSVDDFWNLPKDIVNECVNVFKFVPFYLDEAHPDAPRWVIRALFKSWFYSVPPSALEEFTVCNTTNFPNMYSLNLRDIYNVERFKQELLKIGTHYGLEFDLDYFSESIHNDYVAKVPNKNSRQLCKSVFDAVKNNISIPIAINISEESYVEYLCEKYFGVKFSAYREKFFKDTSELRKYIDDSQ
jgi:hypothetical protein